MKKFLVVVVGLFVVGVVSGQGLNGGWSVHMGGVIPVGRFACDGENIFNAKSGVSIGAKRVFAVAPRNLGLFVSADLVYNAARGSYLIKALEGGWEDVKRPVCLNIPVIAGFNYRFDSSPFLGFWAEAGVGLNIRKITEFKCTEDITFSKYNFNPALSMSAQMGAGIILDRTFSIALHYYSLGEAKIRETNREKIYLQDGPLTESTYKHNFRMPAGMFAVRLGYHF